MIRILHRKVRFVARRNQEGLIRASFRLTGSFLPSLTAQIARRIFMTPMKFRRTSSEKKILARAHPFEIKVGNTLVKAWRWGEGPQVLLVHGWSGRGGQMIAFVDPLLEAGYSVLTFDAPAHGDSEGKRVSLFDFAQTIQNLAEEFGPFHGTIAHSFGGPAMLWALEQGVETSHLILMASPMNLEKTMSRFARRLGLTPIAYHELRQQMEQYFNTSISSLNYFNKTMSPSSPTLIVHDLDDKEVNWAGSEKISKQWSHSFLMTTKGLGHYRILRNPDVIEKITSFLSESEYQEPSSPAMDLLLE